MAVVVRPRGVGVAVFKKGCLARESAREIALSLGKGELLRAGYVLNPCGARADIGASLAQALAVREWFRTGPSVGGACVPEEFIVGRAAASTRPAFISALMMGWSLDYAESCISDAKATKRGPGWLHVVRGSASQGRGKEDVLARLSDEERDAVGAGPARATVEAVALGLRHLGRWRS